MQTLQIDHEKALDTIVEKSRDEYSAMLEKATVSMTNILGFPYSIIKNNEEIRIKSENYSAVNLKINGEDTKFQGVKFDFFKTLNRSKNYIGICVEYSYGVTNGCEMRVIDRIEDVDNGSLQYNMAKFGITKEIYQYLYKMCNIVQNF